MLVLLGLFSWEYRVDTNSINPVSRALRTGKKACIHAGLQPFDGHSHSIVAGGLDVISYTIRLIWGTSLTIRTLIRSSTS